MQSENLHQGTKPLWNHENESADTIARIASSTLFVGPEPVSLIILQKLISNWKISSINIGYYKSQKVTLEGV